MEDPHMPTPPRRPNWHARTHERNPLSWMETGKFIMLLNQCFTPEELHNWDALAKVVEASGGALMDPNREAFEDQIKDEVGPPVESPGNEEPPF